MPDACARMALCNVALALNAGAAFLTLDAEVRAKVAEVFPSLSFAVPQE